MKAIGVIPARFRSSRYPGKPLVDIGGKTMIECVYARALKGRLLSRVLVATEDSRIESLCRAKGMDVVMTADTHPTGTDRVAEVARKVRGDVYVNIQGDEPLIAPDSIDAAVKGLRAFRERTAVCLMKRITDPSELISVNVPKVVVNDQDEAVFFSRLPIPYAKGSAAAVHRKQVCVYAFSRSTLARYAGLPQSRNERVEEIELLRLVDNRVPLRMVEVFKESVAVDVPGDVERVRRLLKGR